MLSNYIFVFIISPTWFEVTMAMSMKMAVSWVVAPCRLL
jgi:hypothetical protein